MTDLSPLLAFFLLNVLTSATAAVGAEIPSVDKNTIRQYQRQGPFARKKMTFQNN
jgi:hypothetical protein